MAYTVPSGYRYYDASAAAIYTEGQVFNGTAAVGDSLTAMDGSNKPSYSYEAAQTLTPGVYGSNDTPYYSVSVSAGFRAYVGTGFTGGALNYFDQIAGGNVVIINIYSANMTNTTTITHIPNKVEYINCYNAAKLTSISGTMPNTLKYFNAGNTKLTSVPSFNSCTQWKYGYYAFKNTALVTAPSLPSGLEVMDRMFEGCASLTTASAIPSTVTRAYSAYESCSKLTSAPVNNSTILSNIGRCFTGCIAMTSANNFIIRGTSTLIATSIFMNCTALQTGPQSISASDLAQAFYGCVALQQVPPILFAQKLDSAFYGCSSLVSFSSALPASVTSIINMCSQCVSLISTPDLSNTRLLYLTNAFLGCAALKTITSFPAQNGSELLHCPQAFANCTSLEVLPILPDYIGNMTSMFSGCSSLQPQNIYIPYYVTALNNCFLGASNLSGVVTLNRTLGAINNAFGNVNGPIIITGDNNLTTSEVLIMGENVYKELNVVPTQIQAVRCSDTNGTLSDTGNYIHLIINFTSIVISDALLYVPKIYLDNDQQEPIVNWQLTNNDTETTITINESTSISAERILAGDLIQSGIFETYLNIEGSEEDAIFNYKIYIASSVEGVYIHNSSTSTIDTITKYWNGIPGTAIFTSTTYIFDVTPDGQSFKIGGPIDDNNESGFVVGNRGIPILSEQYPSMFNGPVTFTSEHFLEINESANDGTVDKLIYNGAAKLGIEILI